MDVKNQHILVIGTQVPWIEAILLDMGAKKITILEYNDIVSEHPKLFPIKPKDFTQKYLNGTLEQFDAMVTFSSIEHSGLGTYGDSINPWGDLITMARAWCTLKPKAKALVGVPYGPDVVQVYLLVGFRSGSCTDSRVRVKFGLQSSGFYRVITLGLPSGFALINV